MTDQYSLNICIVVTAHTVLLFHTQYCCDWLTQYCYVVTVHWLNIGATTHSVTAHSYCYDSILLTAHQYCCSTQYCCDCSLSIVVPVHSILFGVTVHSVLLFHTQYCCDSILLWLSLSTAHSVLLWFHIVAHSILLLWLLTHTQYCCDWLNIVVTHSVLLWLTQYCCDCSFSTVVPEYCSLVCYDWLTAQYCYDWLNIVWLFTQYCYDWLNIGVTDSHSIVVPNSLTIVVTTHSVLTQYCCSFSTDSLSIVVPWLSIVVTDSILLL